MPLTPTTTGLLTTTTKSLVLLAYRTTLTSMTKCALNMSTRNTRFVHFLQEMICTYSKCDPCISGTGISGKIFCCLFHWRKITQMRKICAFYHLALKEDGQPFIICLVAKQHNHWMMSMLMLSACFYCSLKMFQTENKR